MDKKKDGAKENISLDLEEVMDVQTVKERNLVQIVEFARIGYIEGIKKLITNRVEINAKDTLGQTAACVCASRNDLEGLRALANGGADLSIGDNLGRTPKNWAIKYNNFDMLQLIDAPHPSAQLHISESFLNKK